MYTPLIDWTVLSSVKKLFTHSFTHCVVLGSVAGPEKLQPLLDKNQEMFNAFVKAVEELAVLRNNLNKTEVQHAAEQSSFIHSFIHSSLSSLRA